MADTDLEILLVLLLLVRNFSRANMQTSISCSSSYTIVLCLFQMPGKDKGLTVKENKGNRRRRVSVGVSPWASLLGTTLWSDIVLYDHYSFRVFLVSRASIFSLVG